MTVVNWYSVTASTPNSRGKTTLMSAYWGSQFAQSSLFSAFFLRSSTGGVAYVTVFNSSATWAATFRLRGYKSCACWLFLCFHNPLNSDMDYRIFDVCTWSLVCMRIHTHGGWAHRQRVNTTFLTWSWKNKVFLTSAPDGIRILNLGISSPTL